MYFWLENNNSNRLGGFAACKSITSDGSTRTRMFPRARTTYMHHLGGAWRSCVHVDVACASRKSRFRAYASVRYIEYGLRGRRRLVSVHAIISLEGLRGAVHACCKVSHVKMRVCMCMYVEMCVFVCMYVDFVCVCVNMDTFEVIEVSSGPVEVSSVQPHMRNCILSCVRVCASACLDR